MTTTRPRAYRGPDRFNRHVLGRDRPDGHGNRGYWSRQREVARSVVENPVTLVPTGHMVGKSFLDAGILLWFLFSRPGSLVIATAPSETQLKEVLIKEVERAYHGARVPLGGRVLRSPAKIDLGMGWQSLAYSTSKPERFSGHHNTELLTIVDEYSGVDDHIYEAIAGQNPSRELLTGNPLRPSGTFYERCRGAANGENPLARVIHVSSLESPHIHLARSPWGLADATWLAKVENDYGVGSLYWQTHVLGTFPAEGFDVVIPRDWIDLAASAVHQPGGTRRTAIDLGLGNGGDKTVVLTRDDNGILAMEASNLWSLEAAAAKAAEQVRKFRVEHHNVSFDVEGIGADFDNRLRAAGIVGARAYRGGKSGGKLFTRLRAAAAWKLRQRLDPARTVFTAAGVKLPQTPFSIRREFIPALRPELQGLRYEIGVGGVTALERAEDYADRLKHSPDYVSALTQSFAFEEDKPAPEPASLVTAAGGAGFRWT